MTPKKWLPRGRGSGRGGLGTTKHLVPRKELAAAAPLPALSRKRHAQRVGHWRLLAPYASDGPHSEAG